MLSFSKKYLFSFNNDVILLKFNYLIKVILEIRKKIQKIKMKINFYYNIFPEIKIN